MAEQSSMTTAEVDHGMARTVVQRLVWVRRVDLAWLTVLLIFAALLLVARDQAVVSAVFTAESLWKVLPFLLLSVAIAAYAKASGADNLIARAFRGHAVPMVIFASLMGALSPFCSCGVIPLIAALLSMGVPLAPVMAFWLASPIMDPSMFVITAATLGTTFAIGKTVAAIGIGLLGGFGTIGLQRVGLLGDAVLRDGVGNGGCGGSNIRNPKAIVWRFWSEAARRESFAKGARDNLLFLGKWLTLAFLLESLMLAYVPSDLVANVAGGEGPWPVIGASLIGIFAYLNGYAALPLVSGLMDQGIAAGAGMAFLVAGGVTSLPAAIAVYALARPRVFGAYLGFALIGAIASGFAYGALA